MNPWAKLRKLYRRVPAIECPAGCSECCGPVCMMRLEARRMGLWKPETDFDSGFNCELLKDGRCSKYERRPFVCRLMGTANGGMMRCPIREQLKLPTPLTEQQVNALMSEYMDLYASEPGAAPPTASTRLAAKLHDVLSRKLNP